PDHRQFLPISSHNPAARSKEPLSNSGQRQDPLHSPATRHPSAKPPATCQSSASRCGLLRGPHLLTGPVLQKRRCACQFPARVMPSITSVGAAIPKFLSISDAGVILRNISLRFEAIVTSLTG